MLAEEAPWAQLIANRENVGLAAANNQGLAASRGEAILISNPDILFSAGAIDALCGVLDRRPRAAFVVPRLLHPDGRVQTSAGDLPSFREAFAGRAASQSRGSGARGRRGFWWDGWAHDEEVPIGHGAESCYIVRAKALAEIGMQDRRFFLDWEGIEWSRRAARGGWEIWLCKDAEVIHLGGESVQQNRIRWVLWSHAGMYRYFSAEIRAPLRPILGLLIACRALVKLAALAIGAPLYDRANRSSDASTRDTPR
jgi:GT2 family glycosyltransferase